MSTEEQNGVPLQRGSEFIADDVTSNKSNNTRRMLVKEYRKIGRGAFGTVVQAYLTQDKKNWLGPFAIKKSLLIPSINPGNYRF